MAWSSSLLPSTPLLPTAPLSSFCSSLLPPTIPYSLPLFYLSPHCSSLLPSTALPPTSAHCSSVLLSLPLFYLSPPAPHYSPLIPLAVLEKTAVTRGQLGLTRCSGVLTVWVQGSAAAAAAALLLLPLPLLCCRKHATANHMLVASE